MPELAEQNSRVSEKKEETANALGSSEYVKMLFGGYPTKVLPVTVRLLS